jgi:hypothetical protein
MSALCDLSIDLEMIDSLTVGSVGFQSRHRWPPGSGAYGKREDVTLVANSFTALSVPAGSRALIVILGGAVSLTLKGLNADTGISLTPSANPQQIDLVMPLGAAPSIGIASGAASNQNVSLIWL